MGTDRLILLALVIGGAAWLTLHLMLLMRAAGARRLHPGLRALALLPPATPAVAWAAGSRALAVLWTVVGAAYLALWWSS
jgi:hypothetical protein